MSCIVHSDASHDKNTKVGTWGVILQIGPRQQKASGVMPVLANDSCTAEMFAACEAIRMALALDVKNIVVFTDSAYARKALKQEKIKPGREDDERMLNEILSLTRNRGITLWPRGTQSHTTAGDMPALCNRWCDAAARAAMEAHRIGVVK
jgi:ribonuclease HI